MWDDVVIGKGDKRCTATKVHSIAGDHSIAQNSTSFWVSSCMLDAGITVFKDTEEGKTLQTLQAMIDANATLDAIMEQIDLIVLSNIEPQKLKQLIKRENENYFNAGQRAKASEIRAALDCR